MSTTGEFDHNGLPDAIPAEKLQTMLGDSQAFCSWDASNPTTCELMARWPFLFSRPLLGTSKRPTIDASNTP